MTDRESSEGESGLIEVLTVISGFGSLREGWDGESAAVPSMASIADAMRLARLLGAVSPDLEATLHVDGTVLLESGEVAMRLTGDGRLVVVCPDGASTVPFDGTSLPTAVMLAVSARHPGKAPP